MTFVDAITALSQRFLTEHAYSLIVEPALADLEYDIDARPGHRLMSQFSVIVALIGACWDDAIRGGHLTTFAGLSLIPLCYYSFWFLVWVPQGVRDLGAAFMTAVTLVVIALSLGPVIVCYWPERSSRNSSIEP